MVAKSYIYQNIMQLEKLFNNCTSVQNSLFYSKLAILELCGWIEMSMDDIIKRHARRNLKNANNINYIDKEVVEKTHGFKYQTHFRRMLIAVVGTIGVERVEKKVDPTRFLPMVATLGSLKGFRDKEAHEYIKGTTKTLDAPSVTKTKLVIVYNGLKNIDDILRTMK